VNTVACRRARFSGKRFSDAGRAVTNPERADVVERRTRKTERPLNVPIPVLYGRSRIGLIGGSGHFENVNA
jgi:hypothetical protein